MATRTERRLESSDTMVGADGRQVTVHYFQTYIIHQPLSGPATESRGAYSLELDDGRTLAFVDEHSARLDETGEIFRFLD